MRSSWLYLATRSDRAGAPVLICPESVADAQDAVDDLNDQVARWSDPAYIQAQARERLYYILPGDVSYLIVGEAGTSTTAGQLPISDEIQTTKTDWVGGLLASAYTAGLTQATPDQLDSPQQETPAP